MSGRGESAHLLRFLQRQVQAKFAHGFLQLMFVDEPTIVCIHAVEDVHLCHED